MKDGCYNLLLAAAAACPAIIYCWQQQQHVRGRTAQLSDISSGATCVADLDSGALALTKEACGACHKSTKCIPERGYEKQAHTVISQQDA